MEIGYYLKDRKAAKTSVYAVFRFAGVRYKVGTGASIAPENWDVEAQAIRGRNFPDYEIVSILLNRFEIALKTVIQNHTLAGTTPTPDGLRADVRSITHPYTHTGRKSAAGFCESFERFYLNAGYSYETEKKYLTTLNWLRRYETKFRTVLQFDGIDLEFYDRFRAWILSQEYRPRQGAEPRRYTLNYVGSLMKCIKRVMEATGPDSRNPQHTNTAYKSREFKVDSESADTIYLSVDELRRIHEFPIDAAAVTPLLVYSTPQHIERKIRSLDTTRNKFLLGCFTALRVSDFNRLREINIKENTIRIKPKKGIGKNPDVIIPIHPIVRAIIDSGFDVSTPMTDQAINRNLKELCKLVGLTEQVTRARSEGGRLVERTFEKWELVTTHTARRSGATNMYLAGVPSISIMKITNHRTESSFMKYLKISQEENARLLAGHAFFR